MLDSRLACEASASAARAAAMVTLAAHGFSDKFLAAALELALERAREDGGYVAEQPASPDWPAPVGAF